MKKVNFKILIPILGVVLVVILGFIFFPSKQVPELDLYLMNVYYESDVKYIDLTFSYSRGDNSIFIANNTEEEISSSNHIFVNPYQLISSNFTGRDFWKKTVEKKLTMSSIWHGNDELLKIFPNTQSAFTCNFQNNEGRILFVNCNNEKEKLVIEIV